MLQEEIDSYGGLLDELAELYTPVAAMGVAARNRLLVHVFWNMGKRMADVQGSADYGSKVVERLSADLTEKFGEGFGRSNMFDIRRFATEVPKETIAEQLTWTHYRLLLSINDKKQRAKLTKRTLKEELTCDDIRAIIKQNHKGRDDQTDPHVFPLQPRQAQLNLVKAERDPFLEDGVVVIDFGFHMRNEIKVKGLADIKDGEILQWLGKGKFRRTQSKKNERYCYLARVVRVIDGDTVRLRIMMSDGHTVDESIRLRGVDAPELPHSDGKRVKRYVTRRLKERQTVRLLTYGNDRYGRYVGDLFYGPGDTWLNRELVETGGAKYLDMAAR